MSDVLQTILQKKPQSWSNTSYTNKIYVTVEVNSYEMEYKFISNLFKRHNQKYKILKIERVQHPLAYGRFLLRKEQLLNRYGNVETKQVYWTVNKSDIDEALSYNIDERRTPYDKLSLYSDLSNRCVIILQCIVIDEIRDSNYYPNYVIHIAPEVSP